MYAKIDNTDALNMLIERLDHWIKDQKPDDQYITRKLYRDMYESCIDDGCFDGSEFEPMQIVDNDYINYCDVIGPGDDNYEQIDKVYDGQGLGDCSCSDCGCSFIEASCVYKDDTYYLIRY